MLTINNNEQHLKSILSFVLSVILFNLSFVCQATAGKNEKLAVIVANAQYDHVSDFPGAVNDADAMQKMFIEVFKIPPKNILRYDNLTKGQLEFVFGNASAKGYLKQKVTQKNVDIFVYFSGIGTKFYREETNKSIPYILGKDTRPEALKTTGYPVKLLTENLKRLQRDQIKNGNVFIAFEAGFSGKTEQGELIKGVNAPTLGAPVVLSEQLRINNGRSQQNKSSFKTRWKKVVRSDARQMSPVPSLNESGRNAFSVLTATSENQIAKRNKHSKIGAFTDALIDAFYGEGDLGEKDSQVTVSEVRKYFVQKLSSQKPSILSTDERAKILSLDQYILPRATTLARKHFEALQAELWLAEGTVKEGRDYLQTCVYCPSKKKVVLALRKKQERHSICRVEEKTAENLLESGNYTQIKAFLSDCYCCKYRHRLETKLELIESSERSRKEQKAFKEQAQKLRLKRRQDEMALWLKAIRSGQPGDYREYLRVHPNGKKASMVQNILEKLEEEDRIWSQVIRSNSYKKYNRYIKAYPEGRYIKRARKWLKDNQPKG